MLHIVKPNGARIRIPSKLDEMHVNRSVVKIESEEQFATKVKVIRAVVASLIPTSIYFLVYILQNQSQIINIAHKLIQ
jgi:hypothetical protein